MQGDINRDGVLDISDVAYLALVITDSSGFSIDDELLSELLPFAGVSSVDELRMSHVDHLQKYLQ